MPQVVATGDPCRSQRGSIDLQWLERFELWRIELRHGPGSLDHSREGGLFLLGKVDIFHAGPLSGRWPLFPTIFHPIARLSIHLSMNSRST